MRQLTFGITSSPFLAMQVLRQVADDHEKDYSTAAELVWMVFYVDDVFTGAESMQQARRSKHR